MSTQVKVVLERQDGSELELGPYNQGVHFALDPKTRLLGCLDTAGKVGYNTIAESDFGLEAWFLVGAQPEFGHPAGGTVYNEAEFIRLHVFPVN